MSGIGKLESMSKTLIPYRKGKKWGFCDEGKNIVVPCIYQLVRSFQEGIAAVKISNRWGAIDESSNLVIPCIYEESAKIFPLQFSEGLAVFSVKEKFE